MLKLENTIKLNKETIESPNLCDRFTTTDLTNIGTICFEGYLHDEQSRKQWLRRNEAGMDLALQVQKAKTFPWPDCANVAFPLVTIAAMQFHARAYPALISGNKIVKCAVFGDDETGEQTARATRVSDYMSWQLLYQDRSWEEQEDKAIFNLSIVGTNFKKSYYSPSVRHNVSELVLAKDLVLNYWSKSVNESPRKTHLIPKYRNEIHENVLRGIWRDVLNEAWFQGPPPTRVSQEQTESDKRQGVTPPQPDDATAYMVMEQHCQMDLDGDGYDEPYIITMEQSSRTVLRIVTRFDTEEAIERVAAGPYKGKIIQIIANEYFTSKIFIPSPDGGIYGIGFGVFLGPLNEAVNSLVNMLLDAGTMQTTSGGFLGRGAKFRSGVQTLAPFEWKRVDCSGDDLRKNVFPLPVNAPSDVLFQLLSLLINYTSRVSGTTDITVGENPGQNTPASTTQTMVEMGSKIYTAIFKRCWRSLRDEFQLLYTLNGIYMPPDGKGLGGVTKADFIGGRDLISPVADPTLVSEGARLQQAIALKTAAATTPGYDKDAVEIRYLQALNVEAIEQVFKGTKGTPPPKDPAIALEELKIQGAAQLKQLDAPLEQARLELERTKIAGEQETTVMKLQEEQRLNNAKITELMAKAAEAGANAQSEQAYAQVAMINAEIARTKAANDHINTTLDRESKHLIQEMVSQTELAKLAAKPENSAPSIHVTLPGGKKKISKGPDGAYISEDVAT